MDDLVYESIALFDGKVIISHALESKWPGTQWVLNGKTIEDITWLESNITPKPSQSEIDAEIAELIAAYPLQELREKRNRLLAETDWWASTDLVISVPRKAYRQALRDITTGLDTVDKVNAVTWPTKPE